MSLNYEEIMDRWGETQAKLNDAEQRIAELERELAARSHSVDCGMVLSSEGDIIESLSFKDGCTCGAEQEATNGD